MACGCDNGFSGCYMILKPEGVGLVDLIKILFSPNLEDRKFVECPKGTEEQSFRRRWLIFVSIFLQKFFRLVSKPVAYLGSTIELCLNMISSNRNVWFLVLNFLRGKRVRPDKNSAEFRSMIALLDKRVELDGSIRHNDCKYNAALSVMAAKASYENVAYIETTVKDHWKMQFLGSYDFWNEYQGKATTQACILVDKVEDQDTYIVAFRGTEPFDADGWCSDIDVSWYDLPGFGKIHGGFMKALGLQKNITWPKEIERDESHPPVAYYAIRDILKDHLCKNDKARFILTGHSMGGALATLFPVILLLHDEALLLERLKGVYTFGQPRVGDDKLAEYMEKKLRENDIRYYRFVYSNDIVPRLPYDDKDLMFRHFGTCLYFNRRYEGKIVEEAPNKNYFSALAAILMSVNAFLELIRSFTLAYRHGAEYKEGWLLRSFRVLGLIIPGLPAHFTQDYVNATRLGSLSSHSIIDEPNF